MKMPVIDAHIHLDMYEKQQQKQLLHEMEHYQIEGLIAVSNHLSSAKETLRLAKNDNRIHPAVGYHPEQPLPSEEETAELLSFSRHISQEIIAVGEVGLPYYLRRDKQHVPIEPYAELLEQFIQIASEKNKPIVLHAIYNDAPVVCRLLEKHSIQKAHFHWFKGDPATVKRIIANGYKISVTPDCLYEQEIQQLIIRVPLSSLMVETDGPWPFEGPFKNRMTHPKMMHDSLTRIAKIKDVPLQEVYRQLYQNTKDFYAI